MDMNVEKLTELEYLFLHYLAEGPSHPYRLGREAEDRGGKGVVTLGALYKALHRLEEGGCVRSSWEDVDSHEEAKRPRRRIYRLTALGAQAVKEGKDAISSPGSL